MSRLLSIILSGCLALSVAAAAPAHAQEVAADNTELWYPVDDSGAPEVALFFIYSETCPHCARAKPVVAEWAENIDWLQVEMVSVQTATPEQADTVLTLAEEIGEEIVGVPAFLFCKTMEIGFEAADTTGADMMRQLEDCYDRLDGTTADVAATSGEDEHLSLPVLGEVEADAVSLPVFTVAVAGLDAFNPCAFFVLLFLLSLLVHARSRWRMALVGGVFVVISGVMYFAFMAAWLNVFLVTGQLRWVTAVAGAVALALAVFNLKDYFLPGTGGTLSIPDSAKPGLYARMRKLTTGDAMPTVLLGTVALAAVANSYELLCTAGFPLVFTRVLTLRNLGTSTYYGYLALYNLVYVVPLLLIVGAFVWTLGSRKLSEREGRFLKLMSGMMMLGLGLLLVFRPELLENMFAAVLILGVAVAAAVLVSLVQRMRRRRQGAAT